MAVHRCLLLAFAALVVAACDNSVPNPSPAPGDDVDRTPPAIGHWTIEEARGFGEFPIFWLGERYNGLELTDIYRLQSRPDTLHPENSVTFMYGTCEPPGGAFADGGCSPPLQFTIRPRCENQDNYAERSRAPFRGGGEISVGHDETATYVWTGTVGVRIAAYGEAGDPEAVAQALVALRGEPDSLNDPLPAIEPEC